MNTIKHLIPIVQEGSTNTVPVNPITSLEIRELFKPLYRDPPAFGKGDLDGRKLWFDLPNLRDALTDEGLAWFAQRRSTRPSTKYGDLPSRRRLWDGETTVKLLANSDEYIGIACGDDGQASEIFAVPTAEAFGAGRNIAADKVEAYLAEIWEEILDLVMSNTGSTILVAFDMTGARAPDLDLG